MSMQYKRETEGENDQHCFVPLFQTKEGTNQPIYPLPSPHPPKKATECSEMSGMLWCSDCRERSKVKENSFENI